MRLVQLIELVSSRLGLEAPFMGFNAELRIPLAIALGAVPGALSRYYLTRACLQWFGPGFPYGTFLINLSGSLAMGFVSTLFLIRAIPAPELRAFITVGFLGAFTTFSTYALESNVLLHSGHWGKTLGYWWGSALLGVLCFEAGSFFARRMG